MKTTTTLSTSDSLLMRNLWASSAVDTDDGTIQLWAFLETRGFVEKTTKSGKGILGHYFARRLTNEGSIHIRGLMKTLGIGPETKYAEGMAKIKAATRD